MVPYSCNGWVGSVLAIRKGKSTIPSKRSVSVSLPKINSISLSLQLWKKENKCFRRDFDNLYTNIVITKNDCDKELMTTETSLIHERNETELLISLHSNSWPRLVPQWNLTRFRFQHWLVNRTHFDHRWPAIF